ncbi:MAG: cytochrome d ubiquinol oxidase subunit II [Candidatus Adiutrix sp.]|jgi:cytochrome d ubiquinol oxidase subunit II|nr:cytochrome d ubiquinol oxidase subunit II [Candidatus Adiutrix sp.]
MEYLGDVWFIVWGLLWGIYFALDGYDFGIGLLAPVIGLSRTESAAMHQATGPFWDGNEVWLITAGGVTFAAFPVAYAVLFSSLYTPLMLLLLALILRGAAAEFRHQFQDGRWLFFWDLTLAGCGFLAALLLGVAFSNIFRGLPLDADQVFQGNILNLLHPYALLGGLLFVLMFVYHGAVYLAEWVTGDLSVKAALAAKLSWPAFMLCFLLYVILTFFWVGFWDRYLASPLMFCLPVACLAAFLASGWQLYLTGHLKKAFLYNGLGIICLALTGVMGIYPNLIPSRLDPLGAVTIAKAASSPKVLLIMLVVAIIFVPAVIAYQWWAHRRLAEKIHSDYYLKA